MDKNLNHLGESLYATENKALYDESVKMLLSDPQIIAWILKWTTSEYFDKNISEIIPYIGDTYVDLIPVTPGLTNKVIESMPTESKIVGEGTLYYDVRFCVKLPESPNGKAFRIIVDLEAQKSPYPGYSIATRGIGYGGRMISEQFGRTVTGRDYDYMEKVYSIWLVFNSSKRTANSILKFSMEPHFLHGHFDINERYDLLDVVMVYVPQEGDIDSVQNSPTVLHRMLYDIFVMKNEAEEKIRIIKEKYNLISENLGRRINDMCNLSEMVEERAKKNVMIDTIKNMLEKGFTQEEIKEYTGYPLSLIKEVVEYSED